LEVDTRAECFDEVTASTILRLGVDSPREVPEGDVYVVLKQYTVFDNVYLAENVLNRFATRELFNVLPYQALPHVVN